MFLEIFIFTNLVRSSCKIIFYYFKLLYTFYILNKELSVLILPNSSIINLEEGVWQKIGFVCTYFGGSNVKISQYSSNNLWVKNTNISKNEYNMQNNSLVTLIPKCLTVLTQNCFSSNTINLSFNSNVNVIRYSGHWSVT